MVYWPPFWVAGAHKLEAAQIQEWCFRFKNLLIGIRDNRFEESKLSSVAFLNDLVLDGKTYSL